MTTKSSAPRLRVRILSSSESLPEQTMTGTALWRHLSGDTFARRQARHAAMLEATPDKVKKALLAVFEAGFPAASVCVVSSRQKLEEANRERPGSVLEIEDILGEEK